MKRIIVIFIVLLIAAGPVFSQKNTYQVHTVIIDPGHGGAKPGAQGKRAQEKEITLSVAKKFGKIIEDNYPDVKVIYTRTTDVDISLAERAKIANRNKADLFISIHANSHPTTTPTGVETFVMGLSESRANLEVAKKENADILLEADYKNNADYNGFDPNAPETYVMLTMFQNAFIDKSLNLAQAIQNQYKQNLKTINRGVKQAELYVLYKTTCPSVLTEIGFISNANEEAFMLSDEGQAKIAVSLFNAFMTYKCTEEGISRIADPVINIKGWNAEPKAAAPVKEEPVAQVAQEVQKLPEVSEPPKTLEAPKTPEAPETQKHPVAPEHPEAPETPETSVALESPAPQPAIPPAPQLPSTPAAKSLVAPVNSAKSDAASYFTVQFLVHTVSLAAGAPELAGITDFQTFRRGTNIIYCTGRFRTRQEALQYCEQVKGSTPFKDAWVTQYKAPAASTETAAQSTQKSPSANAAAAPRHTGITYRVQFCTAPREMKAGDPDLKGISDIHISRSGKFYMYTAGDYNTLQEAQQRCKKIKTSTSFRDAFVVAIYKGERISLERAAQLEKQAQ